MQQKLHLVFLLFFITLTSYGQVANRPGDLVFCDDDNDGFVEINLTILDAEVLGTQDPQEYTVSYHLSQSDAANGVNPLSSPYFTSLLQTQTIFIRVEQNSSGSTDITTVNLIISPAPDAGSDSSIELCSNDSAIDLFNSLGGLPQVGGTWFPELASGTSIFDPSIDLSDIYTYTIIGSGSCSSDIATVTVVVNLIDFSIENLTYCIGDVATIDTGLSASNYSFEWSFNGSIIISETQASISAIQPGTYTVFVRDLNFGCTASSTAILQEVDCIDTDDDGVIDNDEDINGNGNLEDDDTDNDEIPNYLDDDDDGDNVDTIIEVTINSGGRNSFHEFIDTDNDTIENYLDDDDDGDNVLTRDEDYNNNDDPTDDDTNMNSIPDYLDSDVALSLNDFDKFNFQIYPNPSNTILTIKLNSYDFENLNLSIIDMQGKQFIETSRIESDIIQIDVSSLQRGFYFVKIKKGDFMHIEKLVVE